MTIRSASMLLGLALATGGTAVHASDFGEHASFALFAGGNAAMPGSFRGQTVPLETGNGSIVYDDLKFKDTYDSRYSTGAEFDYAFSPQLTGFGRFGYSSFNGRDHAVGNFFSDSAGITPVMANFDDTNTRDYDLGARYSFNAGSKWRPFLGAALGATRLSATRAEFANASGSGTTKVTLGEADTVFSQRVETGLQFSPMTNIDLRLSAAADHLNADTTSKDPNLALVGLNTTEPEVRNHWDYPIELAAVWSFGG